MSVKPSGNFEGRGTVTLERNDRCGPSAGGVRRVQRLSPALLVAVSGILWENAANALPIDPPPTPTSAPSASRTEAGATAGGPTAGSTSEANLNDIMVIGARNTPIPHIILPSVAGGMSQVLEATVPELVCGQCGTFSQPPTIADGEGGFITVRIVHSQFGGGKDTLYAQRVSVTGEELWSGQGVQLFTVTCPRESPSSCIRGVSLGPDGWGGAIVAFAIPGNGLDIVAQRLDHYGKPRWKEPYVTVCDTVGDQMRPLIGADGKGGAFLAWQDFRKGAGVGDIYLQHIDEGGRTNWDAAGVPLYPFLRDQYPVSLRPDGKGGIWAMWYDIAGGKQYNLWSVHMDMKGKPITKKPFWWVTQW